MAPSPSVGIGFREMGKPAPSQTLLTLNSMPRKTLECNNRQVRERYGPSSCHAGWLARWCGLITTQTTQTTYLGTQVLRAHKPPFGKGHEYAGTTHGSQSYTPRLPGSCSPCSLGHIPNLNNRLQWAAEAPADLAAGLSSSYPGCPVTKRGGLFSFSFFFFFSSCSCFNLLRGSGSVGAMDMSVNHPSTLQQIHLHFSPEPRCQQHWGSRHLATSG